MGDVASESEGEGKVECEGRARAADRGALRLLARIQARWNSVFDCINGALQLKDTITRFSENDMELDWPIDDEDDEDTSDGETGGIVEEMVRTTHPHSFFSLICCFCAEVYVFVVFAVVHVARVYAYFHPDHWACYE